MENREEKTIETNRAELAGKISSEPVISHRTHGETFHEIVVGIERKSRYAISCSRWARRFA